jgi:hypothetical protein
MFVARFKEAFENLRVSKIGWKRWRRLNLV